MQSKKEIAVAIAMKNKSNLPNWKLNKIGEDYADLDMLHADMRKHNSEAPYMKKAIGQATLALGMAIDGLPEASKKIVMQKFAQTVKEGKEAMT